MLSFIAGIVCVDIREASLCGNGKSNQRKIMQNLIFFSYRNVMRIMAALTTIYLGFV